MKIILTTSLFIMSIFAVQAQTTTDVFNVSGNCGMCKSRIEAAAKEAGASSASWDADSKKLKVSFDAGTTSSSKIQEKVEGQTLYLNLLYFLRNWTKFFTKFRYITSGSIPSESNIDIMIIIK